MTPTNDMYSLLRAFVQELANCGMRGACTSPGSRCAPLVISLAREPRVSCFSHVDERCAGFFALGLAKASGLPVAVACTSGTAAAELLPAALEAHEARVPLLLLTADRPAELRENGAGQAIDQLKLFGGAAKWFFEVAVHEASAPSLRWMRTLACRAYWTALEGRPGAVHLNFPLREPLVEDGEPPLDETGRPRGEPYAVRAPRAPAYRHAHGELERVRELIGRARRGVVIAGRDERGSGVAQAVSAFAADAGWPLLADPLSGARRGPAAIAHYDALLRDDAFAADRQPDVVLRVGDLPVSKPLRSWLAGHDHVPQIALDPEGAWQDPASVLSHSLALEPATFLEALGEELEKGSDERGGPHEGWLEGWREADRRAGAAIADTLAGDQLSEPALARELGALLPAQATLFVASSMPVREIETFWDVREEPPRVLCNRGANGIDGTVSSAFGAAAHGEGPVVLLIGDVALAHDIGGLLAATRLQLKLTIVLVDNDGGGIFDFLPLARARMALAGEGREPSATPEPRAAQEEDTQEEDIYTRHIATPTCLDFARAAELYGLAHEPVGTITDFRRALERALEPDGASAIVHVRGDRARNVALHQELWRAVSRAYREPEG